MRLWALGLSSIVLGCVPPVALPSTPAVSYGTYFGGSGDESTFAVALDPEGNVILAGTTTSQSFPEPSCLPASESGWLPRKQGSEID
jgi:hypothetical protein